MQRQKSLGVFEIRSAGGSLTMQRQEPRQIVRGERRLLGVQAIDVMLKGCFWVGGLDVGIAGTSRGGHRVQILLEEVLLLVMVGGSLRGGFEMPGGSEMVAGLLQSHADELASAAESGAFSRRNRSIARAVASSCR